MRGEVEVDLGMWSVSWRGWGFNPGILGSRQVSLGSLVEFRCARVRQVQAVDRRQYQISCGDPVYLLKDEKNWLRGKTSIRVFLI